MTEQAAAYAVIWLERLARRCNVHGYADQAALLRRKAEALNAVLPSHEQIDLGSDPRCEAPVQTKTLSGFIQLCQTALTGAAKFGDLPAGEVRDALVEQWRADIDAMFERMQTADFAAAARKVLYEPLRADVPEELRRREP